MELLKSNWNLIWNCSKVIGIGLGIAEKLTVWNLNCNWNWSKGIGFGIGIGQMELTPSLTVKPMVVAAKAGP